MKLATHDDRQPPNEVVTDDAVSDRWLQRVRRAADTVFGATPIGREIIELCDDHEQARKSILGDRSGGVTVIAVVGATGQGKSWLIGQLVHRAPASAAIKTGNNADQATEKLTWLGPRPPADLDSRHEVYLPCDAADMQSIGVPYLLVDSPGSTDDRRTIAAVAQRALSLASVLVVVVRRDQIRSQTVSVLSSASEGILVLPVVNSVRRRDADLDADLDALAARMRGAAPTSTIAAPVLVDDFDVDPRGEAKIGQLAAQEIASAIGQLIQESGEADRRRGPRLAALDARFQAALHSVVADRLPVLTGAVKSLHAEMADIPGEVASTLLGGSVSLRAAIRSRLRLELMDRTSPLFFPYRTLLGLLNLTNGAWDRLFLSLAGSLPSLVGTIWTSAANVASGKDTAAELRDGLTRRSSAAINDRLRPLADQFRRELIRLRGPSVAMQTNAATDPEMRSGIASLEGVGTLQERSQEIFDTAISKHATCYAAALTHGIIGTVVFWLLMSGPIIALYNGYLAASFGTLVQFTGDLKAFPRPDASMLFTSVLLSVLPVAIFAMIVMSISQNRRRVLTAESSIRSRHETTIASLRRQGVLRLTWEDPILADAEFLLSIGSSPRAQEPRAQENA